MVNQSRRNFLKAQPLAKTAIRPPHFLMEQRFVDTCTGCADCVTACPSQIIEIDQGLAQIDFSKGNLNECTFCESCVDVCKPKALVKLDGAKPWPYKASINKNCLSNNHIVCYSCKEICQAEAISFTWQGKKQQVQINSDLCNGCGACLAPCPSEAIDISMPTQVLAGEIK